MKKFSYLFSLVALSTVLFIAGCGKDDEPAPIDTDDCDTQVFPTGGGTATVKLLNFPNEVNGLTTISASSGDVISFAVEINKGTGSRPQKLRIYQSSCANTLGQRVSVEGQANAENSGERIDLRNADQQVRTVLYTVPSGYSELYVTLEVDESGDKFTYKRILLNISGSGIVDSYAGRILGGNSNNSYGSRMNSQSGQVFFACDAAGNIDLVDISYAVSTVAPNYYSYISSNPARFAAPISLSTAQVTCQDETFSTGGGKATYFKNAASGTNFDTVTDAQLSALTVSAANDPQYVQVTGVGQVIEFLNAAGKKGLIKVTAVNQLNNSAGSITIDVKVQR